jgi:hypothetical protein
MMGILVRRDRRERLDADAITGEPAPARGRRRDHRHLTGGMEALLRNPGERRKLVADAALMPSAVEEMLRWVTPIQNMNRTATRDVELGGERIREGDKLLLLYPSANRDERAFERALHVDRAEQASPSADAAQGDLAPRAGDVRGPVEHLPDLGWRPTRRSRSS